MNSPIPYHYTWIEPLFGIVETGVILPSAATGEVPGVVWCSAEPQWESISRAAAELRLPDIDTLLDFYPEAANRLPARIAVDPRAVAPWDLVLQELGVDPITLFHLAQTGYEWGSNPDSWHVVPDPIPISRWLSIEVWVGHWEQLACSRSRGGTAQCAEIRRHDRRNHRLCRTITNVCGLDGKSEPVLL